MLALCAVTLVCGSASAALQPLAPVEGVAVLDKGVVWGDEGRVLFQGFGSGAVTLEGVKAPATVVASSGTAVAVLTGEGLRAGLPPGRLLRIGQIHERVRGGVCRARWSPAIAEESSDFVVAGNELVAAGVCGKHLEITGDSESTGRQPLFVRGIRGGSWRVLRWLRGQAPPVLASEGDLLTIGAQVAREKMEVTTLNLTTGLPVARFRSQDGYLKFASNRRLVVAVPGPCEPEPPDVAPGSLTSLPYGGCSAYRAELYSLDGRPLADLGRIANPSLISHMHVLQHERLSSGGSALVAHDLLDSESRRLIGFNVPARTLDALAFRWPAVAVVAYTEAPLSQSEVTCGSGEYHRLSGPFLSILDLARPEPFIPPPPLAQVVLPTGCPPISVPPALAG